MQTCNRCGGAKEVHGMGYMLEKCPACNGMGVIKPKEEKDEKEEAVKKKAKK